MCQQVSREYDVVPVMVALTLAQLGSDAYVDFLASKDVVAEVRAATEDGLGPHAVLLLAVSEKPFQQAAEVRAVLHVASASSPLTFA